MIWTPEDLTAEYPQAVISGVDFENWTPELQYGYIDEFEKNYPHMFWVSEMAKPQNFYFTSKHLFGLELYPFQLAIQDVLWDHAFPMLIGSRGASKSFNIALYALRRAIFQQGAKIALVGLTFRTAKIIFEICEKIYNNSPILQSMFPETDGYGVRKPNDRWELRLGESLIFAIPTGNGESIRGQRANYIVVDEFSTMPKDIYEIVIKGFSIVSSNPIITAKRRARIEILRRKGLDTPSIVEELTRDEKANQIIVAGTAYYRFNNFYSEWRLYHDIITNGGDREKLIELIGEEAAQHLNPKDFAIIRIPVELTPPGFLDEKIIAQAMATSHRTTVQMEYGAVFPEDSDGFFKRSLVESCVTDKPIMTRDGEVQFSPRTQGEQSLSYVFGIDPASEADNFAITVLECHPNHRRIVYSWTTRRKFQKAMKNNAEAKKGFYKFCADKLKALIKVFPTELVCIDTGGGGHEIIEQLADETNCEKGELPIYPMESYHFLLEGNQKGKYECYDNRTGLHIVFPFTFNKYEWVRDFNHGLKKDFEDQVLLFPTNDSIELASAIANDLIEDNEEDDRLENVIYNINEMKKEVASIIVTANPLTGRESFILSKEEVQGIARRKDRYSALLMANGIARMAGSLAKKQKVYNVPNDGGYSGAQWFNEGMKAFYERYI